MKKLLLVGMFVFSSATGIAFADSVQNDNAGTWTDDYNAIPPGDGSIDIFEEMGAVFDAVTEDVCFRDGNGSFYTIKQVQPLSSDAWEEFCLTLGDAGDDPTDFVIHVIELDETANPVNGIETSFVVGADGCVDLSSYPHGLEDSDGGIRIRVEYTGTLSGASAPCVDKADVTWNPISRLNLEKTVEPSPIPAGSLFTVKLRYSINFINGQDVVIWDKLPEQDDGVGPGVNDMGAFSNFVNVGQPNDDEPTPQNASVTNIASTGAQYCGPGGVTDGADGDVDGFCTIAGTDVPINSIFWHHPLVAEGVSRIEQFVMRAPNGTINGTAYTNVASIAAANSPDTVSSTNTPIVTAAPRPAVNKYFGSGSNTIGLNGTNFAFHGSAITYRIAYNNGNSSSFGQETMYCTHLFDDLSHLHDTMAIDASRGTDGILSVGGGGQIMNPGDDHRQLWRRIDYGNQRHGTCSHSLGSGASAAGSQQRGRVSGDHRCDYQHDDQRGTVHQQRDARLHSHRSHRFLRGLWPSLLSLRRTAGQARQLLRPPGTCDQNLGRSVDLYY